MVISTQPTSEARRPGPESVRGNEGGWGELPLFRGSFDSASGLAQEDRGVVRPCGEAAQRMRPERPTSACSRRAHRPKTRCCDRRSQRAGRRDRERERVLPEKFDRDRRADDIASSFRGCPDFGIAVLEG